MPEQGAPMVGGVAGQVMGPEVQDETWVPPRQLTEPTATTIANAPRYDLR
jgi:hypothetical protein